MSNINQKQVSPKVAKYLKEVGYPQIKLADSTVCEKVDGLLIWIAQPTYLSALCWLYREKRVSLNLQEFCGEWNVYSPQVHEYVAEHCADPEEAIIAAIEYLCDNDLIK